MIQNTPSLSVSLSFSFWNSLVYLAVFFHLPPNVSWVQQSWRENTLWEKAILRVSRLKEVQESRRRKRRRGKWVCLVTEKPSKIVILTQMHYTSKWHFNLGIYQMSSPQRPLLDLLSETIITQSCRDVLNDRSDAQKLVFCLHFCEF